MSADKEKAPMQKSMNPKDYEMKITTQSPLLKSPLVQSPLQTSNPFYVLNPEFPPISPVSPSMFQTPPKGQSSSSTQDSKSSPYFIEKVSYSKCVIKRIIRPTEWASYSSAKNFSVSYIPQGYNYHDYRMAWYRAFLLRPFDHSWFFTFHSNCHQEFPIWFHEWWLSYGPTIEILPPTVLKGYNLYVFKM